MRRLLPLLFVIAGCDASPGAGAAAPGTAIGASGTPAGEALPPLDPGGATWVADQPGRFEVAGSRVTVLGGKASGILFHVPPLGEAFGLRWREPRGWVNGAYVVRWMLDPGLTPKAGRVFAAYELRLEANGDVSLSGGGRPKLTRKAVPGPRTWALAVRAGHATVTLNGEVLADFDHAAGHHPAPYLAIAANTTQDRPMVLEDVAVDPGTPGPRTAVIRQWSLEGRGAGPARFNVVGASDLPGMAAPALQDTLPALLPHVVAAGGYPLGRAEALVYARTDGFSGGNHAPNGVFLRPGAVMASALAAHELAHGYGQGGALGPRSGEGWLVEGLADYLGHAAYGRYRGLPAWRQPPQKTFPADDPPLTEPNAETKARGGSIDFKVYGKGRLFLTALAAYTSEDDVRAVIAGNRDAAKMTGERFVAALEARTGKDLAFLRPGWLVPGAYAAVTPRHGVDSDGDGLLDLQEIAMKTRPDAADSDGDGASDFAERVAGTDPLAAGDAPRGPTGLGLGEGLAGVAEEPVPHEGNAPDPDGNAPEPEEEEP